MSPRSHAFAAAVFALSASLAACVTPRTDDDIESSSGDELSSVPSFGSNPGNLKMYVHAPV